LGANECDQINRHIEELDKQIVRLTCKGWVEGWDSYTSLMQAKSTALLALAMCNQNK
jgi:hypothetical protein